MTDANPCVRYWGPTGCVVLGKAAADAEQQLIACLDDPEPVVRIQAARPLAGIGNTEDALPVLRRYVEQDRFSFVLRAVLAINQCNLLSAAPTLRALLQNVDEPYASRVVSGLLENQRSKN